MALPVIPWFKAGDTFSYGGTVSGLAQATTWVASAEVRSQTGILLPPPLTVALAEAADYSSTGDLVITLYAAAAQTAGWIAAGGAPQNLTCDIKFTASGDVDPIVHSEKFIIQVVAPVTP